MFWKVNMFVLNAVLLFLLGLRNVASDCDKGQHEIRLTPTEQQFDLHLAMNKFRENPKDVIRGQGKQIYVTNGDLLIMDSNDKTFSIEKLCLTVKGADEVDIVYFGYGLIGQVARDSKKLPDENRHRICSHKLPKMKQIRGLWMRFTNSHGYNGFITVKKLNMKTCVNENHKIGKATFG